MPPQPDPSAVEPPARPARPAQIRVVSRTYQGDASALAEVLVMLFDRSVARRRASEAPPPDYDHSQDVG